MPPADAVPAAADRPEPPPGRAGTDVAGRSVPPPRPVPAVEITSAEAVPAAPAEAAAVPAASAEAAAPADVLTEREQRILAFERQWWRHAGAKEQAIRDTFGLSATRYYQLLNALLDRPAALAAEPVLVGRLRRLRASRARTRRR